MCRIKLEGARPKRAFTNSENFIPARIPKMGIARNFSCNLPVLVGAARNLSCNFPFLADAARNFN